MTEPIYPREMLAQRLVQVGGAEGRERPTLFRVADTVFFASLILEEGEHVPIAVVHAEGGCDELAGVMESGLEELGPVEPSPAWRVTELKLQNPEFTPEELVKLARGLRWDSHVIVVAGLHPELSIVGFARREPGTDGGQVALFAAPRPGALVIELAGVELLHYENGQQVDPALPVVFEKGPVRAAIDKIAVPSTAAVEGAASWVVSALLREMRAAKSGGILAMLSSRPPDEVLAKIKYRPAKETLLSEAVAREHRALLWRVATAHIGVGAVAMENVEAATKARYEAELAHAALLSILEDLGSLSAVDGALLLGPGLAVYGAGHFVRPTSRTPPPEPLLARDVEGKSTAPGRLNVGARHKAAFTCAFENEGSVVFVISEDGPVRCVMRMEDNLLLWPVHLQ